MTASDSTPQTGGGLPVIQYWAEQTVSSQGVKLWQTLSHQVRLNSCHCDRREAIALRVSYDVRFPQADMKIC
ncbi:hypothetical protein PMG71_07285 [Roseofilum sp. BLCC_M154]|uniref:Uncharacterized protein n=1 Tax=Roseofilum acuticapitatum BLCC-M154 TaxID=3022444 RepID=A0ABT7AQQ6_9CYAN|nr:hypothetical protein [Roseofilum acuticapitatum]MDJ1169224.1 hypothetical protein [Roseofilum acuticapitatum BLCC-M154]